MGGCHSADEMDVPQEVESKVTVDLVSALRAAGPQQRMRIVVRLGPASDADATAPAPSPGDYPSREAWRNALIERQRSSVARKHGQTIEDIRRQGVEVLAGGSLSTTLVLEGSSASIVKALQFRDVVHADIDRKLSVEEHSDTQ
jgi:hypothetical protein